MDTRSHVRMRMRRAGITALFAVGLCFAGIAPANALEGKPVQEDPYLGQSKAIARIEVPRLTKGKDSTGQEVELVVNDVCTGVLLDAQHIATVRQCVPSSLTPYNDLANGLDKGYDKNFKNVDNKKIGPARITFGRSALPSTSKTQNGQTTVTYNPEQVFWGSSAVFDAGKTQLTVVKLDRPVPADVGAPVKLVNNAVNGYDAVDGTMYGWRQVAGVPELVSYNTPMNVNYLVNDKQEQVRTTTGQWKSFMDAPISFDGVSVGASSSMGSIDWRDVRKGFGDMNLKVAQEDRGAPVLDSKGNLVAIHVNSGVMLDASQANVFSFLGKRPPAGEEQVVSENTPNPERASLKIMQKYLCSSESGATDAIDGFEIPDDTAALARPGGKYTDEYKDPKNSANHKEKKDYNMELSELRTSQGAARPKLWRVDLASCPDNADSGVTSIASTLAAAQKVSGELNSRIRELEKKRDASQTEANAYANLLTSMQSILDDLNGYNVPNRKAMYNRHPEYQTLPEYVRNGIKFTDANGDPIVIKNPLTEASLQGAPDQGAELVKWLNDAAIQLNANIAGRKNAKDNADSALKSAQDQLDKSLANKAYADAISVMADQTAKQVDSKVGALQDKWKGEVEKMLKKFIEAYDNWAANMWAIDKRMFDTQKKIDRQTPIVADRLQKMNDALAARNAIVDLESPEWAQANRAYLDAQDRYNAAKNDLDMANDEMTKAQADHDKEELKKPKVSDKNKKGEYLYVPTIKPADFVTLANQMPSNLLTMQNLALELRAIQDGMKDANLVDPAIIDSVIAQINGYYNTAIGTSNQIVIDGIAVGEKTNKARKEYASAPSALKKALKLRLDNIEQQNTVAANASNSALQAKEGLRALLARAEASTSTEESQKYLNQAAGLIEQIMMAKDGSAQARKDADERYEEFTNILKGDNPKDPGTTKPDDPTAGMTPAEKRKWEREKKKAEEAARKAAEKAAAEEKKRLDGDKDRLARALAKDVTRAAGSDRVRTSIAAWKLGNFPGDSVVIVDGNDYGGIAATPLAGALKAPLLLSTWKSGLEPWLMDQILASGKHHVYLIGDKVPLTPYDAFEFADAGITVHRIGAGNRYQTSLAVNQATLPLIGAAEHKPLTLYLASGTDYADGLTAGAAAGRSGGLMLLCPGESIDPGTYNFIAGLGQTRPLQLIAVGGPAVRAVERTPWPTTMTIDIKKLWGTDRYETAANLAPYQPGATAVVLASGQGFADAISAGALAADQNAILLLTRGNSLPNVTREGIRRYGADKTILVGGDGVISQGIVQQVNGAALQAKATKSVSGDLVEAQQLKQQAEARQKQARADAIKTIQSMVKDDESMVKLLKDLGIFDRLVKILTKT